MIRTADTGDIAAVASLYREIHDAEEAGILTTGWLRDIYPTEETARAALARGDLYVLTENGRTIGSGIINRIQVDVYEGAPWRHPAPPDQVCVLHTLVISPRETGKGYGRSFLRYYEQYAAEHGCPELRLDTNERNAAARAMYRRHGYREIAVVPTVFNGIPDVRLVLIEKNLTAGNGSEGQG